MDIKKVIEISSNPKPYDKGTAIMWTDKHISKELLKFHLDTSSDTASRDNSKIGIIVNSINNIIGNEKSRILDLGCGPGLYTEKFHALGHDVTGIDFSQNSIDYAAKSAKEKGLNIKYICQNYLNIDYDNEFDIITMIYCDFGVLSISERATLLSKIYEALKPGGVFVFDALNELSPKNMSFSKSWEYSEGGFWRPAPYICLSENIHYENEKATLEQHIVFEENGSCEIYRFWNHYFNEEDIKKMFISVGFSKINLMNIELSGGLYNNSGVSFYKITK